MKKKLTFFLFGFLFLFLFAAFSFVVKKDLFTSFDFNTTVKIQNHIPRRLDTIFSLLSSIASFPVLTLVLCIIIIVKRQFRGILVLVLFGLAHVVELIGKLYLDHPGPPFMFFRQNDLGIFFPGDYVVGSSYPSGHSLRAFFLAVIIAYFVGRLTKNKFISFIFLLLITFSFAGAVAIGKIVLGHHWSSDVIGGAFIGLSAGFVAVSFYVGSVKKLPVEK